MLIKQNKYLLFFIVFLILSFAMPSIVNADSLEFEKQWLEQEKNFLSSNILFSEELDVFSDVALISKYRKQLVHITALYECNKQGYSISDVVSSIIETTNGNKPNHRCLKAYYKSSYQIYNFENDLNDNPTYQFLLHYTEKDYEKYFIDKAFELSSQNRMHEAADALARIMTNIINEDKSYRTILGIKLMNTAQNERDALKTLYACIQTMDAENPFAEIYKKISTYEYKDPGFACISDKSNLRDRVRVYQLLGIAVRSPIFMDILQESSSSIETTKYNLKIYSQILEEIETLEKKYSEEKFFSFDQYADMTTPTSGFTYKGMLLLDYRENPAPNAIHRLIALNTKMNDLMKARIKTLSIAELKQIKEGLLACGGEFVSGFFTKEGGAFIITGAAAFIFSPQYGGAVVLTAGYLVLMGTTSTLTDQWEQLDLNGKVSGVCSIVLQAAMIEGGMKGVKIAAESPSLIALRTKLGIINKPNIPRSRKPLSAIPSKAIEELKPKEKPTETVFSTVSETPLRKFLNQLHDKYSSALKENDPRFKTLEAVGTKIKYNELIENSKKSKADVFEQMSEKYLDKGTDAIFEQRRNEITKIFEDYRKGAINEAHAAESLELWDDFSGDVALAVFFRERGLLDKAFSEYYVAAKAAMKVDYSNMNEYIEILNSFIGSEHVRTGEFFKPKEQNLMKRLADMSSGAADHTAVQSSIPNIYPRMSEFIEYVYNYLENSGLRSPKRVYLSRDANVLFMIDYIRSLRSGKNTNNLHLAYVSRSTVSGQKKLGSTFLGDPEPSIYDPTFTYDGNINKIIQDAFRNARERAGGEEIYSKLLQEDKEKILLDEYQRLFDQEMAPDSPFYKATKATYENLRKEGIITDMPNQEIVFIDTGKGSLIIHLAGIIRYFHKDAKIKGVVFSGYAEFAQPNLGASGALETFASYYTGIEGGHIINPRTYSVDITAKSPSNLIDVIFRVLEEEKKYSLQKQG